MSRRLFSNGGKEKILNECPLCGAELEVVELNQYSNVYRILKNGKRSKKRKYKRDEGSMECAFIACSECEFHTDCDLDTDTTGDYEHIYIHENDNHQFMIETE